MKKILNRIFTKEWIVAAGIRALKTMAQTALATIGSSAVLESVNWKIVLSASCVAAICSLLTSVTGLPELREKESDNNN